MGGRSSSEAPRAEAGAGAACCPAAPAPSTNASFESDCAEADPAPRKLAKAAQRNAVQTRRDSSVADMTHSAEKFRPTIAGGR